MKQKIKQMLIKFLGIDELANNLTQVDKELQDCIGEVDGMRMDVDDKPNFYDMETQVEELVDNEMADLIERIEALEE